MSSAVEQSGSGSRPRARWPGDRDLLRFVLRRLGHGLLVALLVLITVFFVTRVVSDPARALLPQDATPQQYEALQHELGLDQPVLTQFGTYFGDLVTFDFGESYRQRSSVSEMIFERLPYTLSLVMVSMLLAWVAGVLTGLVASLRPGTWLDHLVSGFSLVGLSIPHFWLGSMLILLGAVVLGWLPTSGGGGVDHIVLPAITLTLPAAGRIAQITRSAMIAELSAQHIVTARAKGLDERYILFRHALRNVMVPVATICSWEWVYAFAAYSIVVETVFAWPGIGQLVIQAILTQDLILVQGIVLIMALVVVAVNIATDLVYRMIDPRIELG